MTEILVLPLDPSAEAAVRLGAQLEQACAAGLDLGPREAQIACLSGSLARSLHQLQQALDQALAALPADHAAALALRRAAGDMTWIARIVMRYANARLPHGAAA